MEVSSFLDLLASQGVAIAVLAFFLFRLEKRLERIDRLLTLSAAHWGIPIDENLSGDPAKIVRLS